MEIEKQPYRLIGKIQHYEWGTKNEDAFIPKFLGIEAKVDLPYAEYWIGIHQKAPADIIIDNKKYSLIEVINKFSVEILGKRVAQKFDNKIPFLLKILSISKALSIQAHPNKRLAEELNSIDNENYPDNNHKPEIALVIDFLNAIVGLKELVQIKSELVKYPEIFSLLEKELIVKIENDSSGSNDELIKELYSQILNAPYTKLKECILDLVEKFRTKNYLEKNEEQFLTEFDNYGVDVGLISILLLNFISLKSGDAIFTDAGVPHAYLNGNIIECMANSDNVVRAGLTPKYRDVQTLTKMLKISSEKTFVKTTESEEKIVYQTPAEEFELSRLKLTAPLKFNNNDEMKIILVLEGQVKIEWESNEMIISEGEVYLIPAILQNYELSGGESATAYCVEVPI